MILLIDNYDSFTWNLVHYLGQLGAEVSVVRNDAMSVDEVERQAPRAVVLSPGPCDPDKAGICLELVRRLGARLPILGVCLGHQTIGQVYGGRVVRAAQPMHGKVSLIHHGGESVFRNLPDPFEATRYHSLIVEKSSVPDCLRITADTVEGEIMGLQHREFPVHGVQFHPESILSREGKDLLRNFLGI